MTIKKKNRKLLGKLPIMLLALSLLVTAFAGCSDETAESGIEDASSDSSADVSENGESAVSEYSESTFVNESGDVTSTESNIETSQDESIADDSQVTDESTDTSDESSESVSTEPEILGSGTKADPYLMIPDEDKNVTTFEIPAGETQFYSIYRVGATVMTLKSETAAVIHNGETYEPKNGKISFEVEYALASDALLFEISNNGSKSEIYVLEFANPEGSQANPEIIADLDDEHKVSLEAGNEIGYFYKYVAESDGKIRFAISATVDSGMTVQNNRNSVVKTTEADEDIIIDENGNKCIEAEVQKGDELIISVCANPDRRRKYPATEIELYIMYI